MATARDPGKHAYLRPRRRASARSRLLLVGAALLADVLGCGASRQQPPTAVEGQRSALQLGEARELTRRSHVGLPTVFPSSVAAGGGVFLAVWSTPGEVRASRISRQGAILDPAGVALFEGGNTGPPVLWNGSRFVVARLGPASSGSGRSLFARLVAPDGQVISRESPIHAEDGYQSDLSMAWTGSSYLMVWLANGFPPSPEKAVRALALSSELQPLDSQPIALTPATPFPRSPRQSWDGQNHVVTWLDSDLYAVRISAAGARVDPTPLRFLRAGIRDPYAQFWNGREHVLVSEGKDAVLLDVPVAVRLASDLQLVDPAAVPVTTQGGDYEALAIAPLEEGALALWSARNSVSPGDEAIQAASFGRAGVPPGPPQVLADGPGAQTSPMGACADGVCLALWQDDRRGPRGSLLGYDGKRISGDDIEVGGSVTPQGHPVLATSRAGVTAVWSEVEGFIPGSFNVFPRPWSGTALLAGDLAADGSVTCPRLVHRGPAPHLPLALARGDADAFVFWKEYPIGFQKFAPRLRGARLCAGGAADPPLEVVLPRPPEGTDAADVIRASVASDGQQFLLAWAHGPQIRVALAPPCGTAGTLEGRSIGWTANAPAAVCVTWTGAHYLVLWNSGQSVLGLRVGRGAEALDPGPFSLGSPALLPGCTSGGGQSVVVWPSPDQVRGALVDTDGVMPAGFALPAQTTGPAGVVWDGSGFLVHWPTAPPDETVQGGRVSREGALLDQTPQLLTTLTRPVGSAAASQGDGVIWLAWSDVQRIEGQEVARIKVRRILTGDASAPPDAGLPPAIPVCPPPSADAGAAVDGGTPAPDVPLEAPPGQAAPDAAGDAPGGDGSAGNDGGCSCRAGGRQPASGTPLWAWLAAGCLLMRSRRGRAPVRRAWLAAVWVLALAACPGPGGGGPGDASPDRAPVDRMPDSTPPQDRPNGRLPDGAPAPAHDGPVDTRAEAPAADGPQACDPPEEPTGGDPPPRPAPACGDTGLECCLGNRCESGGCCVRGICVKAGESCRVVSGICQAGSCQACGGSAQPCCEDRYASAERERRFCTAPGTLCDGTGPGATCSSCGAVVGADCCSGQICPLPGLRCDYAIDKCVACGQPGNRCCDRLPSCADGGCCVAGSCVAASSECNPSVGLGTCQAGRCSGCGGVGQLCCDGSCFDADSICAGGRCAGCGGKGQACCDPKRCRGELRCLVQADRGTCVECGGEGQPCCNLALASTPCRGNDLVCGGDSCQRCGGASQPCCGPSSTCEPGLGCVGLQDSRPTCAPCGTAGQPCCPGHRCGDGSCCVPGEGGPMCVARGQACPGPAGGVCDGSSCSGCGASGGPCCRPDGSSRGYCATPANVCVQVVFGEQFLCQPCGKLGQVCCQPTTFDRLGGSGSCESPYYCRSTGDSLICARYEVLICPGLP